MEMPADLKAAIANLDSVSRGEFDHDYSRRKKSLLIAYLLWLPGLHYLYLGKFGIQLLFGITAGGFLIWWLVDLVRIPGMVARQNEDLAWDLMSQFQTRSEPFGPLADFLV